MEWFHFIESFDTAVKCFVEHIINQLHSLGLGVLNNQLHSLGLDVLNNQLHSLGLDVLMHMVHNITLVYRSVVMI